MNNNHQQGIMYYTICTLYTTVNPKTGQVLVCQVNYMRGTYTVNYVCMTVSDCILFG